MATRLPACGQGDREENTKRETLDLLAAGIEKKHESERYRISSCLRIAGGGCSQLGHKQMGEINLHLARNTAYQPVLHALGTALLIKANQLSDLGWATQLLD